MFRSVEHFAAYPFKKDRSRLRELFPVCPCGSHARCLAPKVPGRGDTDARPERECWSRRTLGWQLREVQLHRQALRAPGEQPRPLLNAAAASRRRSVRRRNSKTCKPLSSERMVPQPSPETASGVSRIDDRRVIRIPRFVAQRDTSPLAFQKILRLRQRCPVLVALGGRRPAVRAISGFALTAGTSSSECDQHRTTLAKAKNFLKS